MEKLVNRYGLSFDTVGQLLELGVAHLNEVLRLCASRHAIFARIFVVIGTKRAS